MVSHVLFNASKNSLRCDQLRQQYRRLLVPARINKIHWNSGSSELLQYLRNFRVAFGPIRLQYQHVPLQKFLSYFWGVDGEAFIGFAGDTPIGSEVDKYRSCRSQSPRQAVDLLNGFQPVGSAWSQIYSDQRQERARKPSQRSPAAANAPKKPASKMPL